MKSSNLKKKIEEKSIALEKLIKQQEQEQKKMFLFKSEKKIEELEKKIAAVDEEIDSLNEAYNKQLEIEKKASIAREKLASDAKKYGRKAGIGCVAAAIAYCGYLFVKPLNVHGEETTYRAAIGAFEEKEINAADFTPESFEQYQNKLEDAKDQMNSIFMSDEEKLAYIDGVISAYGKLEAIPDKTALLTAINEAEKHDTSPYTPASAKDFKSVISKGKSIYDDVNATKKEVAAAEKDIADAYLHLAVKADKTALLAALNEAEAFDTSAYTPVSVEDYKSIVSKIKSICNDENATEKEVAAAEKDIADAYNQLTLKADKTELTGLYDRYAAYAADDYTPASAKDLKKELENTEKLIADDNASQSDVDAQVTAMQSLETLLVLKADKTSLKSLIDECSQLNRDNYKSGYDEVISEVESVSSILDNENASQEEVDAAVVRLQTAENNLVGYTTNVYRVNMYAYMQSNNSVGNDWSYARYCNGQSVHDGFEITNASGDYATVEMYITENDSYPDSGYGSTSIVLQDGYTTSFNITVVENRGRYSGNTATFTVDVSVSFLRME